MIKPYGYWLKIIDFGLACFYRPPQATRRPAGTLTYIAPETQNCDPQSYGTDIWSVAVIAYEILSGITPFEVPQDGDDRTRELSRHEISVNITKIHYTFDEDGIVDASPEAKDFIQKIFVRNPTCRPCAQKCLEHPWIKTPPNRLSKVSRTVSLMRHRSHRIAKLPSPSLPVRARSFYANRPNT